MNLNITLEAIATFLVVYTGTVAGLVWWLATRFRSLEKLIYREAYKYNRQLDALGLRLQRVELRLFGFTMAPGTEPYSGEGPSGDQRREP